MAQRLCGAPCPEHHRALRSVQSRGLSYMERETAPAPPTCPLVLNLDKPAPAVIMKLRAKATLTTRPEKHVWSLADLTEEWRAGASRVLGEDATTWARTVAANDAPLLLRADDGLPVRHPQDREAVIGLVADAAKQHLCASLRRSSLPARSCSSDRTAHRCSGRSTRPCFL